MVKRSASDRPRLSFEQADRLCRTFLPLGDLVFDFMEQIQAAGFAAWLSRHKFIESFGTPEEAKIHRRCIAEIARERLGRPDSMPIPDLKLLYFSPFLQQLRKERDEANGVDTSQLSTRYPMGEAAWRHEFDPCKRKQIFTRVNDAEAYDARWHAMLDEQRRCLEAEVEQHATGLAKAYTFDRDGRYAFFKAVMERDAAGLGFHYDRPKSRPNYPVFSKEVSEDWDLCWAIEDAKMFFFTPLEGHFSPYLQVRSRKLRGSLRKAQPGEVLFLSYRLLVPAFGNAYWEFYALDELETMIKANLHLYGLAAPVIEEGLRKTLG